ncbi:hypothetical protein [Gluconacetobacter azotocaptans]|uniref:hypothetical protein n=1 Tax=Gluconacetobacter azotocaptans TaxID=142834 RepID=UPI0016052F41|nr:hypothetical protein [Gluconacetobacter azotocaptans]MBM9401640.1 hypothetical protein [Gluconacetobacter azotocaptans]
MDRLSSSGQAWFPHSPVFRALFDQADKIGRDGFIGHRVEQHMEFSPQPEIERHIVILRVPMMCDLHVSTGQWVKMD